MRFSTTTSTAPIAGNDQLYQALNGQVTGEEDSGQADSDEDELILLWAVSIADVPSAE